MENSVDVQLLSALFSPFSTNKNLPSTNMGREEDSRGTTQVNRALAV